MKGSVLTLATVILLMGGVGRGKAGQINLSTGLDASGNLILTGGQDDANWTVDDTSHDPGVTTPAKVVTPNNADWFGGWVVNGPNSDWIAWNPDTTANGLGIYTRTFDLMGYDLSTVSISGAWTLDDSGTLMLNGHLIATLGDGEWGNLHAFSVSASSGFFNQGMNTLVMSITDTDDFLEGVRMDGTLVGSASVPEPASLTLFATGPSVSLASPFECGNTLGEARSTGM